MQAGNATQEIDLIWPYFILLAPRVVNWRPRSKGNQLKNMTHF